MSSLVTTSPFLILAAMPYPCIPMPLDEVFPFPFLEQPILLFLDALLQKFSISSSRFELIYPSHPMRISPLGGLQIPTS
jgi:hypothetical protein